MINWISQNMEWIFSGIGTYLFGGLITCILLGYKYRSSISRTISSLKGYFSKSQPTISLAEAKKTKSILFIDDDVKFKVVSILKKAGWENTRIFKDISSLDNEEVRTTDIFFVDIQGVGKKMDFQEEGLGLALAIKKKYPNKKLVIYSSETKGDRFHEALKVADSFLSKNAEPYEFQLIVEELAVQ